MTVGPRSWCRTLRPRAVAILAVVLGVAAVAPATAGAASTPGADCQPYAGAPCLFPFPDDRLTVPDRKAVTGLRVQLPQAAMPTQHRRRPDDRSRRTTPPTGSARARRSCVHVPGLDNPAAMSKTGAVGLSNLGAALAKRAPIVVIDQATGRRQLIWAELDANATSPATTDLVIHPGKNFTEGHTYIVALRNLRTASGARDPVADAGLRGCARAVGSAGAAACGSGRATRRSSASLRKAGIKVNRSLYEAWNFTVASPQSETGRMLAIRNNAFAQLGDKNLSDLKAQGRAPAFTITSSTPLTSSSGTPVTAANGDTFTVVQGTYQVPCYLKVCGASATAGFHYGPGGGLYRTPTQIKGNVATTNLECLVPSAATALTPARISVYGHGLLGSASEVTDGWMQALASQYDMVFCSTDFWGLAQGDTAGDAAALQNLNLIEPLMDRLQQGALNSLFLGRLMLNPKGLASSPAFQQGGAPVIETKTCTTTATARAGSWAGC